jgi:hypothetical protein
MLMVQLFKMRLFFVLFPMLSIGQIVETNPPEFIKTITFKGHTNESQLPIIRFGEPVILEFDALNGNEGPSSPTPTAWPPPRRPTAGTAGGWSPSSATAP